MSDATAKADEATAADDAAPEAANDAPKRKLTELPIYQPIILGILALASAALLAMGDQVTRGPIAERKAEDLRKALSQVIPAQLHDNDVTANTTTITVSETGEPVTVYRATKDGEVTGVAYQLYEPGYSGNIYVLMGIAPDGTLLGVRVTGHTETPGLGDKIEVAKHDWILGFEGKSLTNPPEKSWGVKKDGGVFDQFAGATITPRSVVKAVKNGLDLYAAKKFDILTAESAPTEQGK